MSRIGAMITFAVFAALHAPLSVAAEEFAPYGTAKVKSQQYPPLKYVVESSAFDPSDVTNTLRVARQMLSLSPKGSQMTVVVIGGAIRAFAKENYEKYQGIVDLAAELRDAGVRIAFCGSSLLGPDMRLMISTVSVKSSRAATSRSRNSLRKAMRISPLPRSCA